MQNHLYIFDATNGNDGAPCIVRCVPGVDPVALVKNPNAIGVESDQLGSELLSGLRLNADGVSIRIAPGFTKADENLVARLRGEIDSDLIDALIRVLVDVATALVRDNVIALDPETKRIGQRLAQFLDVNGIIDDTDLDEVRDKLVEFKRILDLRNS